MKEDLKNKRAAATTKKEGDHEETKIETSVIAAHLVRDFLASGSRDKSIRLWEAKSGKCI
jgi:WD40 repeat protein